jgi:hypothetical protein
VDFKQIQKEKPMTEKLLVAARFVRDRLVDAHVVAVALIAAHPRVMFWLIAALIVLAVL